ncbi:MAG: HAD-IC family P-type ATPase [Atopobiaceae bacterium]|nr:HAD-IC family P-type ATPase [Atopobiaceae bacterium]MBR3315638.1 HAD-IC family P-type ATPase [Atopobiaceae bacterium]
MPRRDAEHMEAGITSEEAIRLAKQGKANVVSSKTDLSVGSIIARNVFTYFNAIFALLAVLVIIAGSYKSLIFLPVVIANTVIGIVQQLRAKKVLDKLALLDVSEYTAIRDGQDTSVTSDALVLGDLVRLESGQQIPADAVVVSGEAGVNESLLTGEADEILKSPGDELMSGSFVVSGQLVARLTHVGADSYASQLTAQAKQVKEHASQMVADIEHIILVAGILIIPVGGLLYWQETGSGTPMPEAIMNMVSAVTGMIPEGLYLLVTVALALSAMRLAKHQVLLHDMRSIEELARIDVLCVDKTGTITSDEMRLQELFAASGRCVDDACAEASLLSRYIRTVPDANATMLALREGLPQEEAFAGADVTPFSSKLKYSQVIVDDRILRLGAPEYILPVEALRSCQPALEERTAAGMRVLALVEAKGEDVTPLLFVALTNEIRENAPQTFEEFARQGVEVKVISGDNPLTVSRVAAQARIEGAERYVDASTLDTPEKVAEAVRTYTVFGRVKPDQKKELVEALQAQGKKVAMTGDGVNDILAMKKAECSIAMGTGSDAARQAAQVVLLDSDFSHMRNIVSEGRRDINNITRSSTLFLYKNIFSLAMALFAIFGSFPYPLTANQVSLISVFNIGVPAFLLTFEPNEKKQKGSFLATVFTRAVPAALTSFFAIASMILFAKLFDIPISDIGPASTYLLSAVGFYILAALIRPLNRYRVSVFAFCIVGLIASCFVFWYLFDINGLSPRALVLCVVFCLAEIGVLQILSITIGWFYRHAIARRRPAVRDAVQ